MSTLFERGDKLYAKRNNITVYAEPDGGGEFAKWLFRPQRAAEGEGLREYRLFDELGPFIREFDRSGTNYYEIVSWDNRGGKFEDLHTIDKYVYVKVDDDAVLTWQQMEDARKQNDNDAKLEDLKTTEFPSWKTLGANIPVSVYYQNQLVYLKFANGNVEELTKFQKMSPEAKRVASGVKPDTNDESEDEKKKRQQEEEDQKKDNTILYAVLALIGAVVLVMAFMFVKKRRSK